ncbi:hypothetical protein D3C77_665160 [compost metagenome]
MGCLEQTPEQFGRYLTRDEVTHVAAFADDSIDRCALGVGEGMVAHGFNNAAAAWGLEAK